MICKIEEKDPNEKRKLIKSNTNVNRRGRQTEMGFRNDFNEYSTAMSPMYQSFDAPIESIPMMGYPHYNYLNYSMYRPFSPESMSHIDRVGQTINNSNVIYSQPQSPIMMKPAKIKKKRFTSMNIKLQKRRPVPK